MNLQPFACQKKHLDWTMSGLNQRDSSQHGVLSTAWVLGADSESGTWRSLILELSQQLMSSTPCLEGVELSQEVKTKEVPKILASRWIVGESGHSRGLGCHCQGLGPSAGLELKVAYRHNAGLPCLSLDFAPFINSTSIRGGLETISCEFLKPQDLSKLSRVMTSSVSQSW